MIDPFHPEAPSSSLVAAICRHGIGDPSCSSYQSRLDNVRSDYERYVAPSNTPDPDKFSITRFERVGKHVVLQAKYESCAKCSYEGNKVMVFLDVTEVQLISWRKIDPHFRAQPRSGLTPMPWPKNEAPSPAARFPATVEGWEDAVAYAQHKSKGVTR